MERKFYKIFRKSIAARLLLLFSLLVGGGNSVVADDIEVFKDGVLQTGWSPGNSSVTDGELIAGKDELKYIISTSSISFSDKKIFIVAKRIADAEAYISVGQNSPSNQFIYSYIYPFCYNHDKNYEILNSDVYAEFISNNYSVTGNKVRFNFKNVRIKSIKIVDKEFVLSEHDITAIQSGAKTEDVTFKYTPKTGWNTICVPFQLRSTVDPTYDHVETIFGSDYSAFKFSGYTDGTLSFTKNDGYIPANTPLLVYAPNGGAQAAANPDGFTLSSNVTIAYSNGESARATTANGVTFQGTYAPIAAGAESALVGNYGITNAGQIVNAGTSSSIKGYRAYLTGLPSGGAGARIMILDDDSNTPTDIGLFKMAVPEAKDVYTLSGQRVQKARKGIYVINGKKIVIK